MGQKVNPNGFRVGVNKVWDSQWYGNKKDIANNIKEDNEIRKFITEKYENANIAKVLIDRKQTKSIVTLLTSKPGVLIGTKGAGVEQLKKELAKISKAKTVAVNIREVKKPDLDAKLCAENVAQQLEKRISWRRAMKQTIQRVMKAGALGVKIKVGGRLDGADIARSEEYHEGSLPLQTLRADIDYGTARADTTFGVLGIKVWIYKGEVLGKKPMMREGEVRNHVDA